MLLKNIEFIFTVNFELMTFYNITVQYTFVIGATIMTNNRIVKLPDKGADNDKYDYVYDYNYS
jgi:hypothetical protein